VEESSWFISWGEGESLSALPRESGFELVKDKGCFSAGMGASLSFIRASAAADGWKPRAQSAPAMHSAVIASYVRLSVPQGRIDLWAAGSSGDAALPGISLAVSLESAPGSGTGIGVYGYAASPGYRGPGGAEPARDAAVELSARAEAGSLALKMRASLHSLRGFPDWLGYRRLRIPAAGRPVFSDPASVLNHVLLLCEPDVLSASLSAGWKSGRIAFDFSADRAGLSRAGLFARLDFDTILQTLLLSKKPLRYAIGLKANFAGTGKQDDYMEEGWLDDTPGDDAAYASSEETETLQPSAEGFIPSALRGRLAFSSLKAEAHLGWGGGKGSLDLGVSARNFSAEPEFQVSGRLSLRLFSSAHAEAGLRISTPPGGYAFDAFPGEWPSVAVDWRISARPSRNRRAGI
jgi:hypothetical protein